MTRTLSSHVRCCDDSRVSRCVHILANPIAGGGKGRQIAPELARHLDSRGLAAELHFTERAGHARELAAALRADDCYAAVAVGGDGTVNEVLNGLTDLDVRLAQLPLGTANVLAAELKLPRTPDRCAELIDHGREVHAAIARADERRFLLFAGFGLDARMVHRLDEVRTGTAGKLKWTGPVTHVIRRWPDDHIRLETDDGTTIEDLSEVLVTRIRNYGGFFTMPGAIDIEDGLLHVVAFRQRSRLAYIGATWRAFRGSLRPGRDVEICTARSVRVASDAPVPCQVDGDAHGHTPAEISLEGADLRLLVPTP